MKIWELERAAKERQYNGAAWHIVMSAIENALEDTRDETPEFERLALASLESNLCDPNDCSADDIAWFIEYGVRW